MQELCVKSQISQRIGENTTSLAQCYVGPDKMYSTTLVILRSPRFVSIGTNLNLLNLRMTISVVWWPGLFRVLETFRELETFRVFNHTETYVRTGDDCRKSRDQSTSNSYMNY